MTNLAYCTYRVHVTLQHPAWDERAGWDYLVDATSKSQANRHARRIFSDDGHMGRAYFTATINDREIIGRNA